VIAKPAIPTLIRSLHLLKDKQVERPHRRHGNIPL